MRITFPDTYGSGEIQLDVLRAICGDVYSKSMIDLGCGFAPNTRQLNITNKTFVDICKRDMAEENENFHVSGICEWFENNPTLHYDISICMDCIEHFTDIAAINVLQGMINHSNKQVIFTPLGGYLVEVEKTDNLKYPDAHRSGWLPKDFEKIGWATIVFTKFHELLGVGAFFSFKCSDLPADIKRIKMELSKFKWFHLMLIYDGEILTESIESYDKD